MKDRTCNVHMEDFFPPRSVVLEDFYPNGIVPSYRVPDRKLSNGAGEILIALVDRLKDAAEAEIELLSIMNFCHLLLKEQGIDLLRD